jgi:membrane fusion protein, multidrug efflux system
MCGGACFVDLAAILRGGMRAVPSLARLVPVAIAVAVIGGATVAIGSFLRQRELNPYTDDASIDADVVHIAPIVSGRILRLVVQENQLVKRGDILFEIDPEPFKLRAELAAAELKAAEALLDTQRRTVATETSNAAIAGDQVTQARSSLQLARNTLERLEPLLGKGYVSAQQLDDARTAKQKAETAYSQALEQAAASKTAIGNLDSALASVEARRSSLALAERDVRETVVRAPHDGRVTGLGIETGEHIVAGQSPFTLVVTENWYASANFRETELGHIAVGTCAVAYSLIDRQIAIKGKVAGTGWGVTDQDRVNLPHGVPYVARSVNWVRVEQRFPVRVHLLNPPADLMRLGASAFVEIRPGGAC